MVDRNFYADWRAGVSLPHRPLLKILQRRYAALKKNDENMLLEALSRTFLQPGVSVLKKKQQIGLISAQKADYLQPPHLLLKNLQVFGSCHLMSVGTFLTGKSLERYTSLKEWDNGYLVVMAKYSSHQEEEATKEIADNAN